MTNEDAVKWIKNLKDDIGTHHNASLWHYEQALCEIIELLKEQDRSKHGHWVVFENCSNAGVYCSECHIKMFDRYPMKKKFSQYCGHCGAHNDLQVEVR